MQIYINGRFLTQSVSGAQRYAIELTKALDRRLASEASPGFSVFLLAPRGARQDFQLQSIAIKTVGILQGHLWEQLELPWNARGGILFSPCAMAPILMRRQVITIHDAVVYAFPDAHQRLFRIWHRLVYSCVGRRALAVLTDSEFSKCELVRYCGIDRGRIHVISLAASHIHDVLPNPTALTHFGLQKKSFVLSVSTQNPYKNFAAVLRAAEILCSQGEDITFAIAGAENPRVFKDQGLKWSKNIRYLGRLDDRHLRALYEGAAAFLFPSFYEGFGLPPLEAMTCGCPVIASNAGSIPEVCGGAALLVDPHDPRQMAEAVIRVVHDPKVQAQMIREGFERSRQFSWDRCAMETLDVLKQIVSSTTSSGSSKAFA
jgi:glycosyltransferase involved in cell wall biosynthesis